MLRKFLFKLFLIPVLIVGCSTTPTTIKSRFIEPGGISTINFKVDPKIHYELPPQNYDLFGLVEDLAKSKETKADERAARDELNKIAGNFLKFDLEAFVRDSLEKIMTGENFASVQKILRYPNKELPINSFGVSIHCLLNQDFSEAGAKVEAFFKSRDPSRPHKRTYQSTFLHSSVGELKSENAMFWVSDSSEELMSICRRAVDEALTLAARDINGRLTIPSSATKVAVSSKTFIPFSKLIEADNERAILGTRVSGFAQFFTISKEQIVIK